LQGLKPEVDLISFIGPAEAVPLLQSLREWTIRRVFHQAVKSCPFKAMSFSAACKALSLNLNSLRRD
jgi:hypothetical protein